MNLKYFGHDPRWRGYDKDQFSGSTASVQRSPRGESDVIHNLPFDVFRNWQAETASIQRKIVPMHREKSCQCTTNHFNQINKFKKKIELIII